MTPDFGGLVVNAVYGTGASATKAPVTNYKLLDKDGNEFDKTAKLPYGDTTIKVSYTEGSVTKTKTVTLTAKKNQSNFQTSYSNLKVNHMTAQQLQQVQQLLRTV